MVNAVSGVLLVLISLVALGSVPSARAVGPAIRTQAPSRQPRLQEFVSTHCTGCHNDRARAGGLSLTGADTVDVAAQAELWEKVLHKVRTGQMPPAGRPRPEPAVAREVMARLAAALDQAAAATPQPTRVGVHRLNRTEYANAIRDLLALEIDAKALLLPDEADEGFDNVAASLSLAPSHLERYLSAARDISRRAIGHDSLRRAPASTTYRVPKLLEQDVRVSEAMPFGSRGGVATRHHFPHDGEYVFKIRLRRQVYDYIIGMGHPQQLDIRVDGRRIKRVTVGGEGKGTPGPLTWNGEIVGDTEWELYMHAADAALEVRAPIAAGVRVVTASFVDSPWEPEGVSQPLQVDFGRGSDEQYDGYAAVDALTIHGPYVAGNAGDTPSRRAVLVCTPKGPADERACATKILTSLARRAYRRPISTDEGQTLMTFYDAGRERARRDTVPDGTGGDRREFESGIQAALERLLVSFNFLFRLESEPPNAAAGSVYRLSDLDLASRLSFFLWSSIPDDELLTVAARGQLKDPAMLERQVRRMLRDSRSSALVDSFGSQWLGIRKAASHLPDPNVFPEFDENLRSAFQQETALFLDSQLRDDRSILDLLSADYTFVNERLAQHYDIPGVYGERFRKVTVAGGTRGGLLGQGGILMVTSYPDRTAPVLRGFWVLDNLLGMPPPPPPPDVPDLEPTATDGRVRSIREQMERHRENPACSACHVRMDPIGFAMENFDAIGRWRTHSGGLPVEASAVFADGTPLEGVAGLKRLLVAHRDDYVHTFTSKLLTYALGRHVDYRDQPAIRQITRDAAAAGYRWSAIILGIVKSTPFQLRKAAS